MSKKLGFALGSGGSRGCAHIGFLKAMEEEGIRPDFIAGTSMGSVVGACYASGYDPEFMAREMKKLKFGDLFDISLNPVKNAALLRSNKMRNKLLHYLKSQKFNDLDIPFKCVALDIVSGKRKVFGGDESVVLGVTSSSTIPSIFKPVEYNDMVLVDGGLTCRVPVDVVRDMGAEVVVAVDVLGQVRESKKKYNMLNIIFRMFDIVDSEITNLKKDVQRPDLFIEPDLGEMSQYKFKQLESAIEIGYLTGKANAEKIKELID